ncbi:nicotinate-nucleotide adenylyltransferase [Prochlorococcus sp. AH-716-D13]|nr:nicotinate-nucleotide adenylyltransferase [Prochlorococcus sp. AH-716-D13]
MKFDTENRIALFGTSADPPTIGHKKILEELSNIYSCVITYASDNPKKKHKENIFFRNLLLKSLIKDINNPKIIFNQKISSQWAIESIEECKKIYPFSKIDFVIGSDLITEIFSWKNFDKITHKVQLLIIKREGYPIGSKTLKVLKTNKVIFKISSLNIPKISSSMVRLNNNYSDLPKSLIDIVKKNNLYESIW